MVRLKGIMESADTKTLVLVDEIGTGTDPQEGASLSVAILNRLIAAKVPTVVTTHHGVLKAFANSTDGCTNGSMAFDQKSLTPTYRFNPHLPGSSYALEIARRVGVPEDVIAEARTVLGEDRTKLDDLIIDLTEKVRKYESLLSGQQDKATSSENAAKRYQEKLKRLEAIEKDLKKRAKQKIQAVERAGRKRIETLVREIQEEKASRRSILTAQQKLKTFVNDEKYDEITDDIDEEIQSELETRSDTDGLVDANLIDSGKTLERGDWVTIDDSTSKGEVMEVSARQRRVCVAVGSVQLWINFDRVRVVSPPAPPAKRIVFAKLPDVPFELDVRGLEAVEALERVDRYLFDGAATSREKLGIIHGKGAGVLSKRVRKLLHRHKVVDSYRFGEYGEGDYGVTIVTLKKG
jgi:DNA mismatch repair protein MutS2